MGYASTTSELRYISACGATTGRVVAARVLPGVDLLSAIEEICAKHNIQYGQISTSIGSLRRVSFNYVSRLSPKPGEGHTTHVEMEGPFGLLSGQGLVSPAEEPGKMNIHYHAVVSGEMDRVLGGHVEPGTITLSTVDVFVTELKGLKIVRSKDAKTGIIFTRFEEG